MPGCRNWWFDAAAFGGLAHHHPEQVSSNSIIANASKDGRRYGLIPPSPYGCRGTPHMSC
ncbi:MAG: hypothetical protein ABIJ27_05310 [Candidatus Omnitrophota bacterium]